ncbi:MAG: PAS domain S-box protein, partial [Nitrospirae bacterium]|nr:PAS domain S-box protein [Nitrospirota bacterium]
MLDRIVGRLNEIGGSALFWGSVAFSEALTLAVVSVMSLAFHGRIAADYLVTGSVAAFVVSSIVVWVITRLLAQLRETAASLGREAVERERTVRDLRESEDRYRALVEYSPFAVVAHRGGEIFYANPAAVDLMGGSGAADLVGRSALDLVHPDYRDIVARRIRETQREEQTHLDTMEQKYVRLDGRPIDVEVAAISITHGGRPATLVVGRDITGRKQAESDSARLGAAVEQGDLAVVITELDGTIVYVNPAFERTTGYGRAEVVGKNPRI